jgi:hypothetical protein
MPFLLIVALMYFMIPVIMFYTGLCISAHNYYVIDPIDLKCSSKERLFGIIVVRRHNPDHMVQEIVGLRTKDETVGALDT